ncbi:MAG TPA: O-methyltransferase [Acidimicrobiales bacterium]
MRKLSEIGGKRLPFLRWSAVRMVLSLKHVTTSWQVGDGREEALAAYVLTRARKYDVDDAIRVIDDFCYQRSVMMNVGDEKGLILDAAIARLKPQRLLELGTYCGYSALRSARVMPADAHLCSIEFVAENAEIAGRILEHAGVADRVNVVVGSIGDGGATADRVEAELGLRDRGLDFAFIDHDKKAYLPDLQSILDRGWLHPGSVVVADNVKVPGAPAYRAYMQAEEGRTWHTTDHVTHVEYQTLLKDLVLESEYLGG